MKFSQIWSMWADGAGDRFRQCPGIVVLAIDIYNQGSTSNWRTFKALGLSKSAELPTRWEGKMKRTSALNSLRESKLNWARRDG